MIAFFRRIRKGLLEGGRASKYLLYAIGEIALVVIGILIALQINNWNEERIEHQNELELIGNLQDELYANLEYVDYRLDDVAHREKNSLKLLNLFDPNPVHITLDSLINLHIDASAVQRFMPKIESVKRIVTNEEFNWIQGDSLKQLLNEYNTIIDLCMNNFDLVTGNSWSNSALKDYVSYRELARVWGYKHKGSSLSQLERSRIYNLSPQELLKDSSLESYLSWRFMRISFLGSNLDRLREKIIEILSYIESYYNGE